MVTRVMRYAWSIRVQFMKYFLVGISGLFLDIGTLIIFREFFGWEATNAVIVNQFIVLGYNFSLNKYWSFSNMDMPHKQVVRYLILAAFNYAISVAAMYVGNDRAGFDYRLVRIGTIAAMVSWNFFLYKYWVYKLEPGRVSPDVAALDRNIDFPYTSDHS